MAGLFSSEAFEERMLVLVLRRRRTFVLHVHRIIRS